MLWVMFNKKFQKGLRVVGALIAVTIMLSMIIAYSGFLSLPTAF